jgi:hypothetical protein
MTKTFSPSEAALSVLELAKRQPQFVLRFCIIYALVMMASFAFLAGSGIFSAYKSYFALLGTGVMPAPDKVAALLDPIRTNYAIWYCLNLVSGIFLSTMALRKAVRNEDSGAFGLQVGGDEVRLLVASLLFGLVLAGANLVLNALGVVLAGKNGAAFAVMVLFSVVALAIIGLQLGQFGVLTIANKRISVVESYAHTKGSLLRFLGAHVLWAVIALIGIILVTSFARIGGDFLGGQIARGLPDTLTAFLTPGWLFVALISGLAFGLAKLGFICVGAYAWHQMRGDLPASRAPL